MFQTKWYCIVDISVKNSLVRLLCIPSLLTLRKHYKYMYHGEFLKFHKPMAYKGYGSQNHFCPALTPWTYKSKIFSTSSFIRYPISRPVIVWKWTLSQGQYLKTLDPTNVSKNKTLTSQDCPVIRHWPNNKKVDNNRRRPQWWKWPQKWLSPEK